MKRYILAIVLLSFLSSCEREEFIPADTENLIVESYIQPGEIIEIQVSQIDEAENLQLFDSMKIALDGVNYSQPFDETGHYRFDDLTVFPGSLVELEVTTVEGEKISSFTLVPEEPTDFELSENEVRFPDFDFGGGIPSEIPDLPEPIDVKWSTEDNLIFLVSVELITEDAEPILEDADASTLERSFFVGPLTEKTTSIAPNRFSFFGTYRIILIYMREEYATVYENVNATTQVLNNPESNIDNAYGIFTSFNSDTLTVSVVQE